MPALTITIQHTTTCVMTVTLHAETDTAAKERAEAMIDDAEWDPAVLPTVAGADWDVVEDSIEVVSVYNADEVHRQTAVDRRLARVAARYEHEINASRQARGED